MIHASQLRAGLLGAHLSHSFSPRIHAALADYSYDLFEVEEVALDAFLTGDRFDAINVTIPYKKAVIPYLADITDQARRIGAVNTILRRADGTLVGHNTDYDGFSDLVRDAGDSLAGKKVLVLGSGGASLTAVTVAADMGAREVIVISRTGENNYQNISRHADAEILVNATPVGMYPNNGASPLSLDALPRLEAVFDMIYNPARTALLLDAEKRGIIARNGLLMLVSQARRAAEFFTGQTVTDKECRAVAEAMERDTKNIILIGMPGCGKSALGTRVAQALGRPFVDADAEIVSRAGVSIPEIFEAEGEAGFRRRETEALADIAKQSGLVIATGGGVVTRPQNLPLMRQNGRIIFLDVPPEGLSTKGRPLSQARSPEALYAERLPLYRAAADIILPLSHDESKEENTQKLLEVLR